MLIRELIKKIEGIKGEYEPRDQAVLDGWARELKDAEAVQEFAGNFKIKEYLDTLKNDVENICQILTERRELTELERLNLLDRKELYRKFIAMFNAEKKVEEISKQLANL